MEPFELKQKFCDLYRSKIKREGAEELLEYLCGSGSDFFVAPPAAMTNFAIKRELSTDAGVSAMMWSP